MFRSISHAANETMFYSIGAEMHDLSNRKVLAYFSRPQNFLLLAHVIEYLCNILFCKYVHNSLSKAVSAFTSHIRAFPLFPSGHWACTEEVSEHSEVRHRLASKPTVKLILTMSTTEMFPDLYLKSYSSNKFLHFILFLIFLFFLRKIYSYLHFYLNITFSL